MKQLVGYRRLGWSMYVLAAVAASTFWAYFNGLPKGNVPFILIGLPALPFIALGKYFFEQDRKRADQSPRAR